MIKNYGPPFNDKDFLEANLIKSLNHRTLPEHSLRVVVSEDKVDMPV